MKSRTTTINIYTTTVADTITPPPFGTSHSNTHNIAPIIEYLGGGFGKGGI